MEPGQHNLTLRQISYFEEAKIFEGEKDALAIRAALVKLVNRIEEQVEAGEKFSADTSAAPQTTSAGFTMFINEISIGDNSVFLELDDLKMVALNHNVINYYINYRQKVCRLYPGQYPASLKKSSLISEVGGERQAFIF